MILKVFLLDGTSDGGIDFVHIVFDSSGQCSLILSQSKNHDQLNNTYDINTDINKMIRTIIDFQNKNDTIYSKKLKEILKNKLDEVEDLSPEINLVIFHNAIISEDRMQRIKNDLNIDDSYQVSIFDRNDIEGQIISVQDPHNWVEEAKIKIKKEDGHINFGKNGMLVNVYANSIRDLFDRFRDKGLFEQNFRYYIKNKRIDDNIKSSLAKKRDKFWFLNNGIIIGCDDFAFDNDNVKLWKFSIINGCQTATLIGEYKGQNSNEDFVIPCKLVKPPEKSSDEEFIKFISEIAESSNSQKPISDRDLKSNKPEQRYLQDLLQNAEPKIYLEIKRGEKRHRRLEPWKFIINDELGQLILSFFLQQPCTARNGKKKIFADENIYNKVFKRKFDKDILVDLLKLNNYYNEFLEKKNSDDDAFTTTHQENIANNGRFIIIGIIGFLIKYKRKLLNTIDINKPNWDIILQEDNIKGPLFFEPISDDMEEKLYSLFLVIIQELADFYNTHEPEYKTVSNFYKIDKNYSNKILGLMKDRFVDNPLKRTELDKYLQIFC